MASDPFFDKRRGVWAMKDRPDPTGKWVRVVLCKHPGAWSPSKPPRKPRQEAIDRSAGFVEVEYRAKHGLSAAPPRAKALVTYLDAYAESQAISAKAGSSKQLRRHVESL